MGHVLVERDPMTWQTANRSLTLLGISWLMTLDLMENMTSSAELAQLRGHYNDLEKGTFFPFCCMDLAPANGRLIWSIMSVAQNVATGFDAAGNQVHRWSEVGRLLTLNERTVWFSVWLEAWAKRADTPYWLTYHVDVLSAARAIPLLPRLNALPGIRAHRDDTYLCIALFPPEPGAAGVVSRP
jgi:hypothetical protein